MTTRKKNKNQQKETGGFIKKVSSLFNLDTVILFVTYVLLTIIIFLLFCILYFSLLLFIHLFPRSLNIVATYLELLFIFLTSLTQ